MRALKLSLAVALAVAFGLVGVPAHAGVTVCVWDAGTRTLDINLAGLGTDEVRVGRVPDSNQLGYHNGAWEACPNGTVNSANLLVVNGTSRSDVVMLDLASGALAPGHTAEANGASELEVELLLGSGSDTVEIRGGSGSNVFELRSATKAAVNQDNDADVTIESAFYFHLNGGGGNDFLASLGPAVQLTGGNGADDLVGSSNDDNLCGDCGGGTGGKDLLFAGDGDDVLAGGAGSDIYEAGGGADILRSSGGADAMVGGPGADDFAAGTEPDGADHIKGGPGRDELSYEGRSGGVSVSQGKAADDGEAGEGDDIANDIEEITGTDFDDVITGSNLDQTIWGLGGGDEISGGGGDDELSAGAGDDTVAGNAGADTLTDENGYDDYRGGGDRDTFVSELSGGYDDSYIGGPGVDTMDYSIRTDPMEIDVTVPDGDGVDDESDDVRSDIEVIYGGESFDRIVAAGAANTIYGMGGGDALYGGGGPDVMYGGAGDDSLDGQEGSDWLYGEAGYDTLIGNDGAADQLACGVDGGEVNLFDPSLDDVDDCDVPM